MRALLVEIGWGFAIGFVGLACGNSALVQCKLDALRVLPEDPGNATVYDAVDIIERIRACHRLTPDGGIQ